MHLPHPHTLTIAIAAILSIAACTTRPTASSTASPTQPKSIPTPTFCADSAMAFINAQCSFGPRVPGTSAHANCADWIAARFAAFGAHVLNHTATVKGYDGTTLPCRNIMARFNYDAPTRILITAHYDSRAWADNDPDEARHHDPVMAANDGASGVAVMLEIARAMASTLESEPATPSTSPDSTAESSATPSQQSPTLPPIGIDFICFDVEDQGHPQWAEDYDEDYDEAGFWCLGSRLWAEQAFNRGYSARFAINLDMVGGRGARFCQEGYSRRNAPAIVDLVWRAAADLGYAELFPATVSGYVMDDHVPLTQLAQIPAIDIIPNVEGQRSSFGATWHTVADTPENIDPDILAAVGQTLLRVIFSLK